MIQQPDLPHRRLTQRAYVDALLIPQLADGTAEPLTDLALGIDRELLSELLTGGLLLLTGVLLLVPGEQHADKHCSAYDCLQQRGADIVLQLEPVIDQLDAILEG
jgi:hypothetical protein